MKPLFILFIHLGLGGVERKIVDIVNYLAGYRPDLVIYILLRKKTEFDMGSEIKNKKVKIINYLDWAKVKVPYFFPIFVFLHVWRLKPQAILSFLDFCSIPSVWAKLLFFWRKIKVVISEDHYASRIISLQRFAPLRHLSVRFFYPFADTIFSCTQATKKDLVMTYGIPREKIKIIRNWTGFVNKKMVKAPKKYDLVYVGRLSKTKNVFFLLRGVKRLKEYKPKIKLAIVGDGEEKERLERFVRKNSLEKNVHFVGASYQVEKNLGQSKIFVYSPKVKVEGFSLSILEAMALKVPVLTYKFDGVEEVIQDGKNGFIFSSMGEFVKKARWLLSNPPEKTVVVDNAYQDVKKHHSPKNIKDYLQVLGLAGNEKKIKIGLITSRGGHLFQLYQLKNWWKNYLRFWLTDRGGDSRRLLRGDKVYYGYFPESRNVFNAIRNFFLGLKILFKERPDLLISCGAGIAPPIFLAGKILGAKLIFIEPYDFIKYPSLSGRLVAPIVDKLLVQHPSQKKFYRKAEYWGAAL